MIISSPKPHLNPLIEIYHKLMFQWWGRYEGGGLNIFLSANGKFSKKNNFSVLLKKFVLQCWVFKPIIVFNR